MKARSNAAQIAAKYRARARYMENVIEKALRKGAKAIDREQVKNLSGSGTDAPGSYPVPVRGGTLRRGHGWAVNGPEQAAVFNTTIYAMAIHKDRPFLDDASDKVDVTEMLSKELMKEFAI